MRRGGCRGLLKLGVKRYKRSKGCSFVKMNSFFSSKLVIFLGALISCSLWGSAFPCIKLGYQVFKIDSAATADIIIFAGERFALAGILVLVFASIMRKKLILPRLDEIPDVFLLSLFQTIGQYILFYTGLAHTSGINGSIINSLSSFVAILVAVYGFRIEKMDRKKALGCALGVAGVLVINLTGGKIAFNVAGDLMVLLSTVAYAISSTLIKIKSQMHDTVMLSGAQFIVGGLVMMAVGSVMGGRFHAAGASGVMLLVYLALISSVAYTLWGILLKYNNVSSVSIYGFITPIMGMILSMVILSEGQDFGMKHVVGLMAISAGIYIVNADIKFLIDKT